MRTWTKDIYAGLPPFFGLVVEDGHVPSSWLRAYVWGSLCLRSPNLLAAISSEVAVLLAESLALHCVDGAGIPEVLGHSMSFLS